MWLCLGLNVWKFQFFTCEIWIDGKNMGCWSGGKDDEPWADTACQARLGNRAGLAREIDHRAVPVLMSYV